MPRKIGKRFVVEGKLKAITPVHVGGLEQDFTDLSLAVDGSGRFYIPGTSLAGVLRSWLEEAGFASIRDWWGYQEGEEGQASLFVVDDAEVELPRNRGIEIRDGVGIDRKSGAAAYGKKYDMAVIPRGAQIPLRVLADVPEVADPGECEAMLAALVTALEGQLIRLGACKTRGLGRVELIDGYTVDGFELNTKDGMLAYLLAKDCPHSLSAQDITDESTKIKVTWRPAGPMMVKAGYDGVTVDMLPLTGATDDGKLALVLPGSSVKGALRSHAERIMRTLLGYRSVPEEDLLGQVKVPIVDLLFGAARGAERQLGTEARGAAGSGGEAERIPGIKPGAGCLLFGDCYSTTTIDPSSDPSSWDNLVSAGNQCDVNEAPNRVGCGPAEFQQAYHVAVDRWTNAVKDGALYTVLEPHGVQWEPLQMVLNLRRIKHCEDLKKAVQALLLLVLRDLSRGIIPLGFGVNRGMGDIKVESIDVSGGGLDCVIKKSEIQPRNGFDLDAISKHWAEVVKSLSGAAA